MQTVNPKKSKAKYTEVVAVKLSKALKEHLDNVQERSGMTKAPFLRKLLENADRAINEKGISLEVKVLEEKVAELSSLYNEKDLQLQIATKQRDEATEGLELYRAGVAKYGHRKFKVMLALDAEWRAGKRETTDQILNKKYGVDGWTDLAYTTQVYGIYKLIPVWKLVGDDRYKIELVN